MEHCASFFGHRDYNDNEEDNLRVLSQMEFAIKNLNIQSFMIGCNGGFDKCVIRYLYNLKKEKYPGIKIYLVLDYLDRNFDEYDTKVLEKYCDEILYPPIEKVMKRYAIYYRNKWMVDNSEYVIFYVKHSWGGASKMMEYAKKCGKKYTNIAISTNSRV